MAKKRKNEFPSNIADVETKDLIKVADDAKAEVEMLTKVIDLVLNELNSRKEKEKKKDIILYD